MVSINLSRERFLRQVEEALKGFHDNTTASPREAIEDWEKFGGYEKVRDFLLEKLFSPERFEWKFSTDGFVINSTVHRYHLIEYLINQGVLDRSNLEGEIVDIGCHLGATVDALALYGGDVVGTDCGRFAYESPSGRPIGVLEGILNVEMYANEPEKLSLVSCFQIGWVEGMSGGGFAFALYKASIPSLVGGGEVLYTFSEKNLDRYRKLTSLPNSHLIELPDGLNKREQYAFTAKKSLMN